MAVSDKPLNLATIYADPIGMKIFRYEADRLPVFIIVFLFAADLAVFYFVDNGSALLSWMCFGLLAKIFIAAWNHHHQHVNTFYSVVLNRLLEIVYTFHTGITTNVWVLHHNLGHHLNYLDQEHDESGWKRKDGSKMTALEYTFITAVTGYFRAGKVAQKHPKFLKGFISMGVVNLALLCLLFFYNPINCLVVFILPMALIYLGTCWNTYYHHAGLETDDHLHASHNVTNRLYNILSGNLGLHTAHHLKQGTHWSELPELHRSIEDKIPTELISAEFPVIGLLRTKLEKWRRSPFSARYEPRFSVSDQEHLRS